MTEPTFQPATPEPGPTSAPPAAPQSGQQPAGQPFFSPVAPEQGYGAAAARAPRGSSNRTLTIVLGIAVLVAAVGISFGIGRSMAPVSAQAPNGPVDGNGFNGGDQGGNGNGNGNGPVNGNGGPGASFDLNGNGNGRGPGGDDMDGGLGLERGFGRFGNQGLPGTVTAVTGDSVTITMATGQTVTFKLDGTTTYQKQVDAAASDVKVGSSVSISLGSNFSPDQITQNNDGSISLGTAGSVTVTK